MIKSNINELVELVESLGFKVDQKQDTPNIEKEITFWNDYSLDPNRLEDDKARKKKIKVDFTNRNQLYNIIKRRREFVNWNPSRKDRKDILRALNNID